MSTTEKLQALEDHVKRMGMMGQMHNARNIGHTRNGDNQANAGAAKARSTTITLANARELPPTTITTQHRARKRCAAMRGGCMAARGYARLCAAMRGYAWLRMAMRG